MLVHVRGDTEKANSELSGCYKKKRQSQENQVHEMRMHLDKADMRAAAGDQDVRVVCERGAAYFRVSFSDSSTSSSSSGKQQIIALQIIVYTHTNFPISVC